MSKADPTPRWYAPWRQAADPAGDDPADLGTAFGLDMSMAPEAPACAAPQAPAKPARRRGWIQRLGARRRPAA